VNDHAQDFTAFVVGHQSRLLRFAFLLTGHRAAAQDLVQTALLEALRRWDRISKREGVEAYVRQVMVNKQRASWRRLSSTESVRDRVPDTPVDDHTEGVGERHALATALAALPPRQRATVILRFYEDMSEADTARLLGCSVGNVKSQTSRGLQKLRTFLNDTQEGNAHAQR
jgi:RNA polymerase sigma-70 factor (sigma-E family)